MGIVSGLLLLPFAGPVRGFRFFLERIHDEAAAVMLDEGRAFADLIDLSMRHNQGLLTDDEFVEEEVQLIARLSSIREFRDELEQAELEVDEGDWVEAEQDVAEEGW